MAITLEIEAVSVDSVNLKWLDSVAPGDDFSIYRSEDGVDYDLIDTTAAAATTYTDSGLLPETRYWYKVANEAATESSAKSVITQACWTPSAQNELSMALPTAGEEVTSDEFNDAMRRLEAIIRNQSAGKDCVACSTNGALVLVCSEGCREFIVDVTEDINSISIIGCENGGDGAVEFKVPAGECYAVCGFPAGFGFSGNECFDTEICGGDDGRGVKVYWSGGGTAAGDGAAGGFYGGEGVKAKTPSGTGGTGTGFGGGGGGGGGPLTLTCLTDAGAANANCSLACGSTKAMRFRASGGRPPYTFSTTSGGTISTINTNTRRIVPPSNPGSGEGGVAYTLTVNAQFNSGGSCEVVACLSNRSCNDVELNTTGSGNGCGICNGSPAPIDTGDCTGTTLPLTGNCGDPPCTACTRTNLGGGACNPETGCSEDKRTAPMISAGCVPCGIMVSKTITVTDAAGTSVSKTIRF